MAVSPQCVRVSIFQHTSIPVPGVHQTHCALGRDEGDTEKGPLFRSRSADYRGDVLIPLVALSSSPLLPAGGKTPPVTLHQLRRGLERRLSDYCVLHVPATSAASFVREHQLTTLSVSLSPPAGESKAPEDGGLFSCADQTVGTSECAATSLRCSNSHQFYCCARCSPTLLAEAAAILGQVDTLRDVPPTRCGVGSAATPEVPLICIDQLQRMTTPRRDTGFNARLPSSSSFRQTSLSPRTSSSPMQTAEEWMQQQQESADTFLMPSEAESLGVVDAENDSPGGEVKGGTCYVAFFSLKMVPPSERAKYLGQGVVRPPEPVTAPAASQLPTIFTVHAGGHLFRMGLPPSISRDGDGAFGMSLLSPTLGDVVVDRLRSHRGLQIERLVDAKSGAAVLPCESALTLLAAEVVTLKAECVSPSTEHGRPEGELTQRLATQSLSDSQPPRSSSPAMGRDIDPGAESESNFFDRRLRLRAHRSAEQYYYDSVEALDWAGRHTLISLSELPSESELQLTSIESQDSNQTPQHVSMPPSTTASPDASSASSLSAAGSGFPSVPLLEECSQRAVQSEPLDDSSLTNASAIMRSTVIKNKISGSLAQKKNDYEGLPEDSGGFGFFFPFTDVEGETAPLSPTLRMPKTMGDSLSDMNDVFLYEDEETIMNVHVTSTEGVSDGRCNSPSRERRSSLVWKTPSQRGPGAATMLGDRDFNATPPIDRARTQTSFAPRTMPRAIFAAAGTLLAKERHTQQVICATTSPPGAQLSSFADNGTHPGDRGTSVRCCGRANVMTRAGGSRDGVRLGPVSVEGGNKSGDITVELEEAMSDDSERDLKERSTCIVEDKPAMSIASPCAMPPSSAVSAPSKTVSGVCSTPYIGKSPTRHGALVASCREETPVVRHEGAAPRRVNGHASPLPSLGIGFSPLSISPAASLSSPSPHISTSVASVGILEDLTTPTILCSTPPPSRSCTSVHELRNHLHDLVPLATQRTSGPPSEAAPLTTSQMSADHFSQIHSEETLRGVGTDFYPRERRRQREESAHSRESFSSRPTALARVDAMPSEASLSFSTVANSSDDANTTHITTPSPSTTVTARSMRMSSPIFFSPGELDRMVVSMEGSDSSQTNSSFRRQPSRSIIDVNAGEVSETSVHTSSYGHGYGGYIASYLLHGDHTSCDREHGGRWGYESQHSYSPLSHDGGPADYSCDIAFHPERDSSQQQSGSSLPDATMPADAAATIASDHHLKHTPPSTESSPSCSAMATWMRCSDEDSGGTQGGAEYQMLVTQQELPIYARQSDSSAGSDVGSDASDDSDDGSYTAVYR